MTQPTATTLERLRGVAAQLIPGDRNSPSVEQVPHFDDLLSRAIEAIGRERPALEAAVAGLPPTLDLITLGTFAEEHPASFELLAATVAGAYFMSPEVLESIDYPTRARSAAPFDLAADELATGILDPVLNRGRRVRMP